MTNFMVPGGIGKYFDWNFPKSDAILELKEH
jgi:hypothetical protein